MLVHLLLELLVGRNVVYTVVGVHGDGCTVGGNHCVLSLGCWALVEIDYPLNRSVVIQPSSRRLQVQIEVNPGRLDCIVWSRSYSSLA